jgi:hypothetical protein
MSPPDTAPAFTKPIQVSPSRDSSIVVDSPAVTAAVTPLVHGLALLVGMNHAFGVSQNAGAVEVATAHSPTTFVHRLWAYSRVRHAIDALHR